ncbi:MAG: hypothetical protein ACYTAO_01575 [Planctomycetota bacterium]
MDVPLPVMTSSVLFGFETSYTFAGVFGACLFHIHVAYVGQCAKPGENIGKFFLFVILILGRQGRSKLADFFNKPHKRRWNTSFPVSLLIFLRDQTLKFTDMHSTHVPKKKSKNAANILRICRVPFLFLPGMGQQMVSVCISFGKSTTA